MLHELLTWLGQGENGWLALLLVGAFFAGLVAVIRALRGEDPWPWD